MTSGPGAAVRLRAVAGRLAICRLDPRAEVPPWATLGAFWSVTRSDDEISVVCDEANVPDGIEAGRGRRALRVVGAMDLAIVGVLAGLSAAIAAAGIALFAISTFDTDYLLVAEADLPATFAALRASGYDVDDPEGAATS